MEKSIRTARHFALAKVLRELRVEAGLRQAELAALLDEPQSFVSKYESGERRLDLIELETIIGQFGVGISQLVERLEVTR